MIRIILICSLLISCSIKAEEDTSRLISKGNSAAVLTNYAQAELFYRQAIKAGNHEGYYYLGVLELNAYGRDKNIKKAVELYTTAANSNYAQAQYELSVIYSNDNFKLKDNAKYLHWLTRSAKNGHKQASHNLGSLAVRVGKTKTAVHYFEKAAQQDFLPSIVSLGQIYYSGIGTQKDYKLAFNYLNRASALNDLEASRLLATLYERGLGTAKDNEAAISLYKKAYEQGNLDAGYNLALLYLETKNKSEAVSILKALELKGVVKAKAHLRKLI